MVYSSFKTFSSFRGKLALWQHKYLISHNLDYLNYKLVAYVGICEVQSRQVCKKLTFSHTVSKNNNQYHDILKVNQLKKELHKAHLNRVDHDLILGMCSIFDPCIHIYRCIFIELKFVHP